MADIFISYRRDDWEAGRLLWNALEDDFAVFYDITKIDYGDKFPESIEEGLTECRILLVVISKGWTSSKNLKRLQDSKDWVRREIQTALERPDAPRILPVRIDGVPMPSEADLPRELQPLLLHQEIELRQNSFDRDLAELVGRMEGWLSGSAHETANRKSVTDQLPALCQLCDRTPQENALPDLLLKRDDTPSNKRVAILAGHKDELHEGFLESLQLRNHLHTLLGITGQDVNIRICPVQWDPRDVQANGYENSLIRGIARNVLCNLAANKADIVSYFRTIQQPLILHLYVDYDCYKKCKTDLFEKFSEAWAALFTDDHGNDLSCAYPVMLWLLVIYENDQQARKIRKDLQDQHPLPELEPLTSLDIHNWVSEPDVKALVSDQAAQIEDRLNSIKKLHMRTFVDSVRRLF